MTSRGTDTELDFFSRQIQLYDLRKNNDLGKINLRVDFMIDARIELQNF